MEINDILNKLGIDLSKPEARRGAIEAIDAILNSRVSPDFGGDGGQNDGGAGSIPAGGGEFEVELDPDLLQPSIKQAPSGSNDDVEIEDEENILDQIKHKESEDPIENTNSAGNDSDADSETSNDQSSKPDTDSENIGTSDDDNTSDSEAEDTEDTTTSSETTDTTEVEDDSAEIDDSVDINDEVDTTEADTDELTSDENSIDYDDIENNSEEAEIDVDNVDDDSEDEDESHELEDEEDFDEDEEEFDFDEDDLLDNELKNSTEDENIKTKRDARKIKRERTLAAAKKALADAHAKKVSPALIRELEKSIEALEALTEAVSKSINDISDEEFNLLVNRVFDAIQACGDADLTFTSEEERAAQVKEIKDDISSAQTQAELSAEDAAKLRAETQAIKAREKETAKYTRRGSYSFKGFQEFLNSLYRAVALQVHQEETQDNSWSAINRRHSGTAILQPGKKIQELPNKKIPVIDFYFDQSGSWTSSDILVGEKAAQSLAEMEANGQIKINIYYFADNVHTDAVSARNEHGTGAWNEIVTNVIATQATNVIIMTDGDMENYWGSRSGKALSYTVPGYVWYLWKNGENAPRLPRDLKGRGGVQQFAFNANDI